MANATAKVAMDTTPWGDDKIKRPLKAVVGAIYYPGTMMALDSSGRSVKCDDTSGIKFDGIACDSGRTTAETGDADGDREITVERPWRFTMPIASATQGDEGRALYAVYDNQVGYTSSNSILVGFVDQVLSATLVLVNPLYAPLNPVAVAGNTLAFSGVTGANTITMPDNLADAFSFKEGSNAYLTFTTTDSAERILLAKATTLTSTSATALVVGPNGATNPTLKVVGSVSSEAGGLAITGGADAVGVALTAIGSNTNEPMLIDGKGSGTVTIGSVSTGGTVVRTKVSTVVATASGVIGNSNNCAEGFNYVTGADDTAPVRLPASVAGKVCTIKNTVANKILCIYPPVSSQINGLGLNAVFNCPAGSMRTFYCATSVLWYSSLEALS